MSVILPVYNGAATVRAAIDSILAQHYPYFEVIVVDDGSQDDTAAVVQAVEDGRVRYVWQPNQERSVARNTGLDQARGEYVAFLDADDLFLPDRLTAQVAALDARPDLDLVASGHRVENQSGELLSVSTGCRDGLGLGLPHCLFQCPAPLTTLLYRRKILDAARGFDPGMNRAEDWDLYVRLILAGARVDWVPGIVSVYRLHDSNSIRDAAAMRAGLLCLVDKSFANPALPAHMRHLAAPCRANALIYAAAIGYAGDSPAAAAVDLAEAARLDPSQFTGDPSLVSEALIGQALALMTGSAGDYLATALAHWPAGTPGPGGSLDDLVARAAIARMYQRYRAGDASGALRSWCAGVARRPSWLLNRGASAVCVRSLFALAMRKPVAATGPAAI